MKYDQRKVINRINYYPNYATRVSAEFIRISDELLTICLWLQIVGKQNMTWFFFLVVEEILIVFFFCPWKFRRLQMALRLECCQWH